MKFLKFTAVMVMSIAILHGPALAESPEDPSDWLFENLGDLLDDITTEQRRHIECIAAARIWENFMPSGEEIGNTALDASLRDMVPETLSEDRFWELYSIYEGYLFRVMDQRGPTAIEAAVHHCLQDDLL